MTLSQDVDKWQAGDLKLKRICNPLGAQVEPDTKVKETKSA